MKSIKLLTAAHVSGRLRHPHEGVLHVENDEEAQRLIDAESAEDVSADFPAKDLKDLSGESVVQTAGALEARALENPHQALVETDLPSPPVEARRKAASKE